MCPIQMQSFVNKFEHYEERQGSGRDFFKMHSWIVNERRTEQETNLILTLNIFMVRQDHWFYSGLYWCICFCHVLKCFEYMWTLYTSSYFRLVHMLLQVHGNFSALRNKMGMVHGNNGAWCLYEHQELQPDNHEDSSGNMKRKIC